MPNPDDASRLEFRLRWRCRRGMLELDHLLRRYMDHGWPGADQAERQAFQRLLESEDSQIWPWLQGREVPDDPELAKVVDAIMAVPPGRA